MRVLRKEAFAYSSVPTWFLHLSCGHTVEFRHPSKDVLTSPPDLIDCPQCEAERTETKGKLVRVQIGDVIQHERKRLICERVNESGSRWVQANAGFAVKKAGIIVSSAAYVHLSTNIEHPILARLGEQGMKDYFDARARGDEALELPGGPMQPKADPTGTATTEMSSKKNKRNKSASKPNKGSEDRKVFGFSVTSVLHRLGKEGVTAQQAVGIMKKLGKDVKESSVITAITDSRNPKYSKPAELTAAQVKELKAMAPAEPAA